MSTNPLYAPWRMDYIRSIDKGDAGACFLCDAVNAATPEERRARLVLWHTPLSVVVINRYPYTNGHLLIAPRAHKADFESLTAEELCDPHPLDLGLGRRGQLVHLGHHLGEQPAEGGEVRLHLAQGRTARLTDQ